MRAYAKEITSGPSEEDKEYVPPISMMAIAGFTRTNSSLPPPTAPYAPNNNTVLSPFSGFWGAPLPTTSGRSPRSPTMHLLREASPTHSDAVGTGTTLMFGTPIAPVSGRLI